MGLFKSNKINVILDQAIFSGTGFVITIIAARLLSIDSFGVFAGYTLAILLVVSGLGAFVMQPFQVLIGKSSDKQEYAMVVFWFQFVLVFIFSLIGMLVSFLLNKQIPFTLLGYGAGFLLYDFGRKLLLALGLTVKVLLYDVLGTFFLFIAVYLFYKFGMANTLNLFAYLGVAYLPSFLYLILLVKPFLLKKSNILFYLRGHILHGKWLFLTAISQWWSSNLFVVSSGIYLGAAALGAFRLSQSLMGVLNVLLQTFENYILPQTAKIMNNELAAGLSFLSSVSRKAGLVFLPVLGLLFVFSSQILVLVGGRDFSSFSYVMKGMSLLYMLVFLSQPIRLLMRVLMLNQHFFYGYLFSLLFSLLCGHVLLSHWGLLGAIFGLALSQILLMSYWTIILHKRNINIWKSFMSF
jgi:O-antigen/teichoic acid export membrane protein